MLQGVQRRADFEMREFRDKVHEAILAKRRRRDFDGSALAAARRDAGLSLKEVADLLGVNFRAVWNWETGKRRPQSAWMYENIAAFIKAVKESE